jgi:hypothetical protein
MDPHPDPDPEHPLGVPTRGSWREYPVPDLDRIEPDRWEEVMRATHPKAREKAMHTVHGMDNIGRVMALVGQLMLEDGDRVYRAETAMGDPRPLPPVDTGRPERPSARQVNFRLTTNEHDQLTDAARLLGLKPTTAARLLTVRGAQAILREAGPRPDYQR